MGRLAEDATTNEPVTLQEALDEQLAAIDLRSTRSADAGILTGFRDLDDILIGLQPSELVAIAARPSVGKAQPLDAQVLTPSGFVSMGEIKVNDFVIGSDGRPTRVTGVYPQGELPVYRVEMSDGAATECCDEHLWFTQTRNERRRGITGSVKTLADIRETLRRVENPNTLNHALPLVGVVGFNPVRADHRPLDPYLLGLLLGDGSFDKTVRFSNPEADIQHRLRDLLPIGDALTVGPDGKECRIKRAIRNGKPSETQKAIIALGLNGKDSYAKFIPHQYLMAEPSERMQLLRGLLDTDGSVTSCRQSIEFSTSSSVLADQVVFLVRSLGGVVSTKVRVPIYAYRGERCQGAESSRLVIYFPNGQVPVSSSKHLGKWVWLRSRNRRSIRSIEPTGFKQCQCIRVDSPDSLYVTDDFIVTHNTALGLCIAKNIATTGKTVLFCSVEQSRMEIAERLLANEASVDSYRMRLGKLVASDYDDLIRANATMRKWRMQIDDASQQTMTSIAASARRIQRRQGLDVVFVDYLQLITPDNPKAQRYEQVGLISRRLKQLARDLKIPVVVMCQVGRDAGDGDESSPPPRLHQLRESGNIEQDLDVAILLHRTDRGSILEGRAETIQVDVAKNRNGRRGILALSYRAQFLRFEGVESGPRY